LPDARLVADQQQDLMFHLRRRRSGQNRKGSGETGPAGQLQKAAALKLTEAALR
jgi:hypothetical protein